MSRERKGTLVRGAVVLGAGILVVKAAGALFKVPLKYAVGAYGMGLFNTAYSVYGPIFALATAGFPVAVARMTSEYRALGRWEDARRVRRAALALYLGLGALGTAALTLAAPWYCGEVLGNPQALAPVLALAPAILFSCVGAVYRGAAEGRGEMGPTALSQVMEAVCKLGLGLTAAKTLAARGMEEYHRAGTVFGSPAAGPEEAGFLAAAFGAAGAVLGVTAGVAVGTVFLAARQGLKNQQEERGGPEPSAWKEICRRLMKITGPVAAGAVAANLSGLLDAMVLQSRMGRLLEETPALFRALPEEFAGMPREGATFLVGCYTLAVTVYLLAPALTQTVGISALPRVTAAWARKDRESLKRCLETVCRGAALICFPAGLGMCALARPLTEVLFGADGAAPLTAAALEVLGLAALGAGLTGPLGSVLQGVERADLPVKLLAGCLAVKTAVTWGLTGVPGIGLQGAAWASVGCYGLLAVGEWAAVRKVTGVKLRALPLLGKPLICAGLCALGARAVFSALEPAVGTVGALAAGVMAGAGVDGLGVVLLGAANLRELGGLLPRKPRRTGEKRC